MILHALLWDTTWEINRRTLNREESFSSSDSMSFELIVEYYIFSVYLILWEAVTIELKWLADLEYNGRRWPRWI